MVSQSSHIHTIVFKKGSKFAPSHIKNNSNVQNLQGK